MYSFLPFVSPSPHPTHPHPLPPDTGSHLVSDLFEKNKLYKKQKNNPPPQKKNFGFYLPTNIDLIQF